MKAFHTDEAASSSHPLFHDDTAVISPRNGVDNEEILAQEIGEEHVLGGVSRILSYITEPDVIEHTG